MKDTEQRILEAAGKLFSQRGFHATGMRAIARAARVSLGTIYHHFKSKDELLLALIRQEVDELKSFLNELISQQLPPVEIIHRMVERHFQRLSEKQQVMQVLQREWFAPPGRLHRKLRALLEEVAASVRELIREGIRAGEIRPCNPTVVAYAILGVVMGITPRALEGDAVAREILEHGPREVGELLVRWLIPEGGKR